MTTPLCLRVFREYVQLCLGDIPFRLWGARRIQEAVYVYRFFILMNPRADGFILDSEILDRCQDRLRRPWERIDGMVFDKDTCFVKPLRCCGLYLREDVGGWVATILQSDFARFGSKTLRDDLCDELMESGVFRCQRD